LLAADLKSSNIHGSFQLNASWASPLRILTAQASVIAPLRKVATPDAVIAVAWLSLATGHTGPRPRVSGSPRRRESKERAKCTPLSGGTRSTCCTNRSSNINLTRLRMVQCKATLTPRQTANTP
jgi:hypothetical protein